ncbi:MAG TPA: arginine--tRNA ligase [Candidatus Paceibacterota bacterium]|nr:arginine--tRNA ligase [Candidatus Paceibacterota bacterium]
MTNDITSIIAECIAEAVGEPVDARLTVPEVPEFGHYATNIAMRLAAARGKKPLALAGELAAAIAKNAPAGFFGKVEAAPPGFINFWLSKKTLQNELARVARDRKFGAGNIGAGKKVIVEYSSPNIAKTLNVGHLRNTIIGDALANIFEILGYRVIRWNYLGDWGTQFGKLIVAYRRWGDQAAIGEDPIEELQKLYVRFHEEAKTDPELERQAQEEFRKLEAGDAENRKLWEQFRSRSVEELKGAYAALGVPDFDVWVGESFFEGELKKIARELLERGIAERSEGALIVRLDEFNLPPALIEKSDGASLYLTRDIANLAYRLKKYKPAKILYVIGNEQTLQFEQLFAVAKKLGMDSAELKHVKYGLVLGESGKKLSTRAGRTVSLKDAILKARTLARQIVGEKARDLSDAEKDEVAEAVGIGALKYNDLRENRMTDIVFDWDKMLDFTGDSAPYLQYTYARLKSVLRKAERSAARRSFAGLDSEDELALMRKIFGFPNAVARAGELYATSILAAYLYNLAVAANKFYETTPILKDESASRRASRLALAAIAARTLADGLALLGIKTPERI